MLKPYFRKKGIEVGVDEAGRGSLVGSVVAAAVILPKTFEHSVLTDSKKVPKCMHHALEAEIKSKALAWAIGEASLEEIEKYNILNAAILAMHRAIDQLVVKKIMPTLLLIDGNRFKPYPNIEHRTEVKGDGRYYAIAAASILAKTYRDRKLCDMHLECPMYGWNSNAGYPTKSHREAIRQYGASHLHRTSFKLL